jgi:His-Xaa-Ser system protein HxsD
MKNEFKLSVDCKIYPLDAVKAACYTFSNRAFVEIKRKSSNKAEVVLTAKNGDSFLPDKLKKEFLNELLHHALRLKIAQNNDEIRKFIVTRALMSASAFQSPKPAYQSTPPKNVAAIKVKPDKKMKAEIKNIAAKSDKDHKKDPMGVKMKWEDKYPNNAKKVTAAERIYKGKKSATSAVKTGKVKK